MRFGPSQRTEPAVALKGAERAREVVDMRIRGVTFEAIGKTIGVSKHRAYKIYRDYLRKIPSDSLEELRKIECERIADLRARLYAEMDGRPDPKDPSKLIPGLLTHAP